MKYFTKSTMMTVYVVVIFFTELTLSVRLRLSESYQDFDEGPGSLDGGRNVLSNEGDTMVPFKKRTCNGFPCMYSHLGSKAAQASLYKTLAGFIDDCFSDPTCDPGRRKRDNSDRIRQLLNTPVSKLNIFGHSKSKNRL